MSPRLWSALQPWLLFVAGLPRWTYGQIAWDTVGWGVIKQLPEKTDPNYFIMIRGDYKFRLQADYVHYTIDIRVNPCDNLIMTGGTGQGCCQLTNQAACQDVPYADAGPDLLLAYFQNAHIVSCKGTRYQSDVNCGTYIEIHKASGTEAERFQVLADVQIDATPFPSGYQTTRIATYQLCMGEHELWWVIRTRAGPYVQKIKKFTVNFPSCASPPGLVEAPESTKGMEGNF